MSNIDNTRRPSHEVFVVSGDDRKRWTRIGIGFTNKDGKGFNLRLDAAPLDGKLVVLPVRDKDNDDNGGQQ